MTIDLREITTIYTIIHIPLLFTYTQIYLFPRCHRKVVSNLYSINAGKATYIEIGHVN